MKHVNQINHIFYILFNFLAFAHQIVDLVPFFWHESEKNNSLNKEHLQKRSTEGVHLHMDHNS